MTALGNVRICKDIKYHAVLAHQDFPRASISVLVHQDFKVTVKSLLEAHALIEAHSPVWTSKMLIFQANFPKDRASNKY